MNWYVALQPASRLQEPKGFATLRPVTDDADGRDFVNLRHAGGRGVQLLIFGIAWMYKANAAGPQVGSLNLMATPSALALDLLSIINCMCAPYVVYASTPFFH